MKLCACCSTANSADAPTCVSCGEASWLGAPDPVPAAIDGEGGGTFELDEPLKFSDAADAAAPVDEEPTNPIAPVPAPEPQPAPRRQQGRPGSGSGSKRGR